jgi:hypothetical protein
MATPVIPLPSLLWRRRQNNSNSYHKNSAELARNPTWPAALPSPGSVAHVSYPQPNLYLQVSQILEWEIWNHNRTRTELNAEKTRSVELGVEIERLSQVIFQWQETCRATYEALDEHRIEHIKLVQEMETITTELNALQQKVNSTNLILPVY